MDTTIPKLFRETCLRYSHTKNAFLYKVGGVYKGITHRELWERIVTLAIGLLNLGFRPNDRVGLISENRIEWVVADIAISAIGAVSVPIFPTTAPKQEEYIFNDCTASAIFLSSQFQLNKIMQVIENIPSIRHLIVFDDIDLGKIKDPRVKSYNSIISMSTGKVSFDDADKYILPMIEKLTPESIHTIIYTSGTTGDPKGVVLTNRNIMTNVFDALDAIKITSQDILLSYLPWCHAYERTAGYYSGFFSGATVAIAESLDTIATNIKEVQPTIMTTVPRLLEVVRKKILAQIEKERFIKKRVFAWATEVGKKYMTQKFSTGEINSILKSKYSLAKKLVFSKITEKLGVKNLLFVSGGAPLNPEVNIFFWAVGYRVLEGYGLTEASPVVSVTREDNVEIGTVGKPLRSVEVKIADDGEILVRGPNVMLGYWNDTEATNTAIDPDGWLYTGDVGYITERGNLRITDRKKYIFVNKGGKNIAPQPIENLIAQSPYVDQCILIGDNREYNVALIMPNVEQITELARNLDIHFESFAELVNNPKIIQKIKESIDRLQVNLSKFERIKRFAILTETFSIENGELSPKLSVRRHIVEKKYSELIEQMYNIKE